MSSRRECHQIKNSNESKERPRDEDISKSPLQESLPPPKQKYPDYLLPSKDESSQDSTQPDPQDPQSYPEPPEPPEPKKNNGCHEFAICKLVTNSLLVFFGWFSATKILLRRSLF